MMSSARRRFPGHWLGALALALALALAACGGGGSGVVAPPPPVPPRIVFDMATGGPGTRRDLYAVELDGSGLARLTGDSADHHGPTSRGGHVFFGSARLKTSVVANVAVASTPPSTVTDVLDAADEPAISADGRQLAYLSVAGGLPRVWVAGADGSGAQRFAAAEGGYDGALEEHAAWSPTDDRIAYVSTRSGNASIFVGAVSAGPGSAALLAGSVTGASVEPSWSPDGSQIVFSSNRDGPTDLYIVVVATGSVSRLTTIGAVGQPVWLPSGKIVFTQWTGAGAGVGGLRWVDPASPSVMHTIATPGDAQHAAALP